MRRLISITILLFSWCTIITAANNKIAKDVVKALKSASQEQRAAILNEASVAKVGKDDYITIIKYMNKAKPEIKTDIINWLAAESLIPEKKIIIKDLEIRFDMPFPTVLKELLKNKNTEVKRATIKLIANIGDKEYVPALSGLLADEDETIIQLAESVLIGFEGEVEEFASRMIPKVGEKGKIAIIEILAIRKANFKVNRIFDLMKDDNDKVKIAAYKALKDVVKAKDLTFVCGMLESETDPAKTTYLQEAVIASLLSITDEDERITFLKNRINHAGSDKKGLYDVISEKVSP